jgi:hypothetical protein
MKNIFNYTNITFKKLRPMTFKEIARIQSRGSNICVCGTSLVDPFLYI